MSIVTFWNDGTREVGQSIAVSAIGTYLSLHHNYKVMIFDTKYRDHTLSDCFWSQQASKIEFKDKSKTDIDTGTSGLTKAILSNKTAPEVVTNYTKIIFKNKLELLTDKDSTELADYNKQKTFFKEMIKMANKFYDLVLIDVSGDFEDGFISNMIENSNVMIVTLSQNLRKLNDYVALRKESEVLLKKQKIVMLGRYDKKSTYNIKNIERHIGEKEIYGVPYNTQFFESSNEGQVAEYFIKLRKIKQTDPNYFFIDSVREVSESIVEKLKRLQAQLYG